MKTTTNWMKTSLALALTLSSFAFAGDRGGNGGSGNETQIAAEQAQLESVAMKIKKFFIQNEQAMAKEFPEFAPLTLAQSITSADLSVTNENLVDRHRKNRTCLNFPAEQKIECNYSEVKSLQDDHKALFVLVMHEYLGLMGVEETSPENPRMIDGYSISKRIAPYVTKVSDYDLQISENKCLLGVQDNISAKAAAVLYSKGYKLISINEVKENNYLLNYSNGFEYQFPAALFCHHDYVDITLSKRDRFESEIKTVRFSQCNSGGDHYINNYERKEARALAKLPNCN